MAKILNAVWGDDSFVIDRIVDSYIRNLRKKLELDCIVTVKGEFQFPAGRPIVPICDKFFT